MIFFQLIHWCHQINPYYSITSQKRTVNQLPSLITWLGLGKLTKPPQPSGLNPPPNSTHTLFPPDIVAAGGRKRCTTLKFRFNWNLNFGPAGKTLLRSSFGHFHCSDWNLQTVAAWLIDCQWALVKWPPWGPTLTDSPPSSGCCWVEVLQKRGKFHWKADRGEFQH